MKLKDWRDRLIYFVLIDRFCNADKASDDFGKGEYDPKDDNCFQGGDLKGVISRLPYIKKLGFDALWITPPVHNQWINPATPCRGYHGYWTYDFMKVDPHFGTLDDYKKLVREAHKRGIKVIQDIVVNHTGNYFTVDEAAYDPARPERGWRALAESFPPEAAPKAPNDPVFGMNNPNDPRHKEAGVYNFTPNITDFKSREQTLNYTLGDLDDINLRSPLAVERLKEIYRFWIKEAGVDGLRVDTVFYTPEDFYERFLHDADRRSPGVKRFALKSGKKDFFVFGEAWSYDYAAINRYVREGRTCRLDSAIDLPLNEALVQVFYRRAPTETLRRPLEAKKPNAQLWVNFLDNHDIERMYSRADWKAVQQSLVSLFTLPGIPCVYYGTERGFTELRQNMFEPRHYRGSGPQYDFLKTLIALRKRDPVFSRGRLKLLRTADQAGVLAYERALGGERRLVVFNTSPARMHFELPRGAAWTALFGPRAAAEEGSLILEPLAYHVLSSSPARRPAGRRTKPSSRASGLSLKLSPVSDGPADGKVSLRFALSGAQSVDRLYLLADSDYDLKTAVRAASGGRIEYDTSRLRNGPHRLSLLALARDRTVVSSPEIPLDVKNAPRLLAQALVPAENRGGVHGNVRPPADRSYKGQLEIEEVSISSIGPELELSARMRELTNEWNSPVGYDHVYFNVFLDIPGAAGKPFLPKLGWCPPGFKFAYGFLFYGWGVVPFAAADSTPDAYGAPLPGNFEQSVDAPSRLVKFRFPSGMFGRRRDFSGLKVFLSTWDGYLGRFHEVSAQAQDWAFSAPPPAAPQEVPKIFNHLLVEVKKEAP